jgi:hypothetical protein
MQAVTQDVPSRNFADPLDLPVQGPDATRGHDPSPDAIGGYYGISWYTYYKDRKTDEVYKVYCTDGVNGGRGPYSPDDEAWRSQCYYAIVARCHQEADNGAAEVRVSANEWAVMQGQTHIAWLESSPKKGDGAQTREYGEDGLIGYCHGVPIFYSESQPDQLPPRYL